ncbi:MAG: DUF177 domain-containing protein [Elusimicrobiaceae bacterium]|nr:DUF177 domain-containing protein [Elusimicrobiaceae bacterium]MBP5616597.1 DUF177 domain-containing protein [Elusimicrobiaceae bacterium]
MTSNYAEFDVPRDLKFKTHDLIRLGNFNCTAQLAAVYLKDVLEPPHQIVKANVELAFSVTPKDILVQGKISGQRNVQCARCLQEVRQDFSESFAETYSTKCEIIDIMYVVKQTLALTEEIRFLCKPDCKGLCAQCGKNLNEGPCHCTPENLSPFAVLKGKFK